MVEKIKAVGLFSGGLDSILSVSVMLSEGIDVWAYHLKTIFTATDRAQISRKISPRSIAEKLGVNFEEEEVSSEFFEIVKNPQYGYGSNVNPCIDCKIFFLKKAKEFMEQIGGRFIFTGEVLGQRPMTQTHQTMMKISKSAGVEDICLRPLSAKFLAPTLSEREGWVKRENLLDIQGRSRKDQIQLAEQFGIEFYPTPAGGCLLTDPGFAGRIKDILTYNSSPSINDILLLKIGRHFRLSQDVKCVVGRNQNDNLAIANLTEEGDILFEAEDVGSPLLLLRGKGCERFIEDAAKLCKRYSDAKNHPEARVKLWRSSNNLEVETITVECVSDSFLRDKLVRAFNE